MKKFFENFVTLALVMVTATVSLVAASNVSVSARPVISSDSFCGPTYKLIESLPMRDSTGEKGGELEVYWSKKLGKHCAVTQSTGELRGVLKYMAAVICLDRCSPENPKDIDFELYRYYAGPVTMASPGKCVNVDGLINKTDGPLDDPYVASKRGWCN